MADPTPLQIKPGVVKSVTPNTVRNRWIDADKVRFEAGKPCKIGGWNPAIVTLMDGLARGSLGWMTLAGNSCLTTGTWRKLYALLADTLTDITPYEATGTEANNPFGTTIGLFTVNVTHVGHGREVGSIVHYSGASAGGGITINGAYTVTSVTSSSVYVITHSIAATSTAASTGGAAVHYDYELNPGLTSSAFGLGYGAGPYGESTYGTPRAEGIALAARHWFISRYNSNIMICPLGEQIYFWDQDSAAARATLLTNSPPSLAMFVTAENYVTALGTDGIPMRMRWADRDDPTDWTPDLADTGNTRDLVNGNKLVAGTPVSDGMNLIFSDTACFYHQYQGTGGIYSTRLGAENAGLVGPDGFATVGARCFWMTPSNFMMYDGSVQPIPRQAEILEWFKLRFNRAQAAKVWCDYHPARNEVWFGFPAGASVEPNEYLILSLDDFSWTPGTLDRTTMAHYPTPDGNIVMCGTDSVIYDHEVGLDADGAAMPAFIKLGMFTLGNGGRDMDVNRYIVDHGRQAGDLTIELDLYRRPRGIVEDTVTFTVTDTDEENDSFQVGGRHLTMTITSDVLGGDFRIDTPGLEIQSSGDR